MTKANERELRRYTDILSVLDMLLHKRLVLVSPDKWDDQNDAIFLRKYAERRGAKSVLALCLANASETYHHWRVFGSGAAGACVVFKKGEFERYVRSIGSVRYGRVKYRTNSDLRARFVR